MEKEIRHYGQVYLQFLSANASKAMSFRVNFIFLFALDFMFYFATLYGQVLIYENVSVIGEWDKNAMLFFTAFMLFQDWLHTFFIGHSFWMFSHSIRSGGMDYVILRPLHPLFTAFFSFVRIDCLGNLVPCLASLIYFGVKVGLPLWGWCALLPLSFLSLALFAAIEMVFATGMFWVQEGLGINFLRMQVQQLSRWPSFIYGGWARRIFLYVIPVLLIGTAPVKFLYQASDWHLLLGLAVAAVAWWKILLVLWSFALERYESASS